MPRRRAHRAPVIPAPLVTLAILSAVLTLAACGEGDAASTAASGGEVSPSRITANGFVHDTHRFGLGFSDDWEVLPVDAAAYRAATRGSDLLLSLGGTGSLAAAISVTAIETDGPIGDLRGWLRRRLGDGTEGGDTAPAETVVVGGRTLVRIATERRGGSRSHVHFFSAGDAVISIRSTGRSEADLAAAEAVVATLTFYD